MHYNLLLRKKVEFIIFVNQRKASIASSVGRSEAPMALTESHRSLPKGTLPTYLIFSIIWQILIFRIFEGFCFWPTEMNI